MKNPDIYRPKTRDFKFYDLTKEIKEDVEASFVRMTGYVEEYKNNVVRMENYK